MQEVLSSLRMPGSLALVLAAFVACGTSAPVPEAERGSTSPMDDDLAWKAIEPLWNRVDIYGDEATLNAGLSDATPGERAIFAVWWYRSEVNNGGHHQFFFNSTGILWKEALEGLRRLEARGHADVLASAVAVFPDSRPSMDREERNAQLERIDPGLWDRIDEDFFSLEDQGVLDERFLAYIRAHPEEFPLQ